MPARKPLTWKARRIPASSEKQLRHLTRRQSVGMAPMVEMAGAVAAEAEVELPDLSAFPTAREKAVRLLEVAASIEHALLVQYLYAGYGFNTPQALVIGVGIEEMSHLMTVQNLLLLIDAEPYLGRQDFGTPASDTTRLFPFDLLLEPVSHTSLAKYVVAESPTTIPSTVDPAVMSIIAGLANTAGPGGGAINRVGVLYTLLGVVFGSEQLLQQQAATGDPWYIAVNAMAALAAAEYGGRDKVHLPDDAFLAASVSKQGTDEEWDRSVVRPFDEFRVHVVGQREAALEALRDIGLQGEGPSTVATEDSHFMRFYNQFRTFFGPDGTGTNPPANVADVPRGARIVVDETSADPGVISHPKAAAWARLADRRYAAMLACLELYFRGDAVQREFLVSWTFAEMFALKRIARLLVRMQRSSSGSPTLVAAAPFTLPQWNAARPTWAELAGVLQGAGVEIQKLKGLSPSTAETQLLIHLEPSDAQKIAEANAQEGGGSVRRKFDRVREILDWGAGAGTPSHGGDSPPIPDDPQGRFWNLQLNDFKQISLGGENIVTASGSDPAPLIAVLEDESMPRSRSPIKGEKLQFIIDWVKAGCPDEPL